MLGGDLWVIDHLSQIKGQGHTKEGMVFVKRVKQENGKIAIICDVCGLEELVVGDIPHIRLMFGRANNSIQKWGHHKCLKCANLARDKSRLITMSKPEWKQQQKLKPSWQSRADENLVKKWKENIGSANKNTWGKRTKEEKFLHARKYWDSLTEEQKERRAKKIGVWAKSFWENLTPQERILHVEKCVKGLPRSKASEVFKQSLVKHDLYDGFQSEIGIAGYIVDEANVDKKLVVEFFGDFYHCNPRIYSSDFFNRTLQMTSSEKWEYDRRRLGAIRACGYDILIIWENEWTVSPEKSLNKMRKFINESRESGKS